LYRGVGGGAVRGDVDVAYRVVAVTGRPPLKRVGGGEGVPDFC